MFKKLIYKIAGIDQRKVVLDSYTYKEIKEGYTGGSLANSNCLIVSTSEVEAIFKSILLKEQTILSEMIVDKNFSVKLIEDSAEDLLGSYEHIINYFKIDNSDATLQLKNIYHTIQVETDYLFSTRRNLISTLTTLISPKVKKNHEVIEATKSLLKGLSVVLGRHGIIINGIITEPDIDLNVIAKWTSIMSSKYAHILSGEIIHLSCNAEGENQI